MKKLEHMYESIFNIFVNIEIFGGGKYDPQIVKFSSNLVKFQDFWCFFMKMVVAKNTDSQNVSFLYGITRTHI